MPHKLAFAVLLLFAVGLAGCSSAPPSEKSPTSTESGTPTPTGSSSRTVTGSPPPSRLPSAIEWTACFGAGAFAYGPNAVFTPSVPPGWEFDWPINEVYYTMFQCERMSVGPFERGPVRGVIEDFSAINRPPACTEGDYTQSSMIANWWIDDPELASFLANLGMPVHYAKISVDPTMVTDAGVHTWRWGESANESSMTFETNQALSDGFHRIQRIFWPRDNMTAIGMMDLDMVEEFDIAATAVGQIAPPAIYAFTGSAMPFVGTSGTVLTKLELSASLRYFGDLRCEQPQS